MVGGRFLRKALLLPYQISVLFLFFPLKIFCEIVACAAGLLDGDNRRAHGCLVAWARSSLALAGLRVEVEGLERLDPQKAYVFMANHASFLDILLIFAHLRRNFRFIIKEETFSIPLMGWALKCSGQIPMDRENPRKGLKSLRQAQELLKNGVSIVAFPEGTRTRDGNLQDFKTTLFILPIRTRTPVVPVLLQGTYSALKRGTLLLNPVPLKLTFYAPVPADSFEDKDRQHYADGIRRILGGSDGPQPASPRMFK